MQIRERNARASIHILVCSFRYLPMHSTFVDLPPRLWPPYPTFGNCQSHLLDTGLYTSQNLSRLVPTPRSRRQRTLLYLTDPFARALPQCAGMGFIFPASRSYGSSLCAATDRLMSNLVLAIPARSTFLGSGLPNQSVVNPDLD